jgi:putative salt-induced outer membrane protein YdiY
MMKKIQAGLTVFFFAALLPVAGKAEEDVETPEKRGWKDQAEFSLVVTSGNAVSRTFGLANTLTGTWDRDSIELKVKAVRAQTAVLTRTATGTADDFQISEKREIRLAAENYAAAGSYTRTLSGGFLFKAGAGWEKNRFAGIVSRTVLAAGLGYAVIETETARLKTDVSLTYTFRSYLESGPERFGGFRIAGTLDKAVSPSASYSGAILFDENLKDFSDWRADMSHALSVSVSRNLALKVGLDLIYIHNPAGGEIPLFGPDEAFSGIFVVSPLKNLDTVFTTSLVVNF